MLPDHTSGAARKRTVFVLAALLAVNAAVAHMLTNQVAFAASRRTQVKDEQVTVVAAEEIVEEDKSPQEDEDAPEASRGITIYTVKSGDTISGIAGKFGITTGTIYAANELTKNQVLKVGAKLVILPITGIQYTVKSGDTISGIANKFDVPAADILDFNDIDDASKIKVGVDLIIPNAEPTPPPAPKPVAKSSTPSVSSISTPVSSTKTITSSSVASGKFINPVPGSVLTQGLHAINAVDLGAPTGTRIVSAAAGTVIVAKGNGAYNGGFGNFVVISHGDGVQTLYAHMSKVSVSVGDTVDQGTQIGLVGNTGKSTGPHAHFEVHGSSQPFAKDKKGTHY